MYSFLIQEIGRSTTARLGVYNAKRATAGKKKKKKVIHSPINQPGDKRTGCILFLIFFLFVLGFLSTFSVCGGSFSSSSSTNQLLYNTKLWKIKSKRKRKKKAIDWVNRRSDGSRSQGAGVVCDRVRVNVDAAVIFFSNCGANTTSWRQLKRIRNDDDDGKVLFVYSCCIDEEESGYNRWFNIGINWTLVNDVLLTERRRGRLIKVYTHTHIGTIGKRNHFLEIAMSTVSTLRQKKNQNKTRKMQWTMFHYLSPSFSSLTAAGHHREIKTWNSDIPAV